MTEFFLAGYRLGLALAKERQIMDNFKQDEEITPVIFRKYGAKRGGDVIALFPCDPGTYEVHTCSSYMQVGQHGSAEPWWVIRNTRPATPAEYATLKIELETAPYGYRLKVYKRMQRDWQDVRWRKLTRLPEGATA